MTDAELTEQPPADETPQDPPQYGVGPFSIREVALVGVWLVAFIVSFFSVSAIRFESVWTSGLLWLLTIGLPSMAVFLIVLRRLSPEGIRRVGSLGIDQFASVAFSVSALLWLQLVWETVALAVEGGPWFRSWVMWVEFVLMLAGVVLTVAAPWLPVLGEDFRYRREITAHRNARPIRPVVARPPVERRVTEPAAVTAGDDEPAARLFDDQDRDDTADRDAIAATAATAAVSPVEAEPAARPAPQAHQQPFWALAPVERDVVDERGIPIFRIGPTAWALVVEDRGSVYVVRHEDGRIGYLHDVSGVTRG